MAIEKTIRCDGDGCDKVKGEVNHWYSALESENSFRTYRGILYENGIDYLNFCGMACLLRRFSRWLGKHE